MKAVWTAIAVLAVGSVVAVAWTARERAREQARPEAQIDARAPDAAEVLGDPLLHAERSALAVLPDAASAVAADSAAGAVDAVEPATFRIEARVVTLEGAPVAHPLVLCASRVLATGDELGVVSADVELALVVSPSRNSDGPAAVKLVVSGPGRSAAVKHAQVSAGTIVQLGTVALGAGVEVTGRVLDPADAPIEGVEVGWLPAAQFPRNAEQAREDPSWPPAATGAPPATRTDVEGRFHIQGVPLEEGFVWAWPWGNHRKGWTEVFRVDPGLRNERTLNLEATEDGTCDIAVRVVTYDGAPAPGASVFYSAGNESTIAPADGQGRSRFKLRLDAQQATVQAKDPVGRGYESESVPVDCETREVVLHLGEPRWLEVAVRDPSGATIESGSVHVSDAEPQALILTAGALAPVRIADGVARLLRPRESFELTAQAIGYRTETFGPFAPDAQGERMTLTLLAGQTVFGRVTSDGLPVAGAGISIAMTFDPGRRACSREVTASDRRFDLRGSARWVRTDAHADEGGRFAVPVKADGWHLLRIEAEGFGIAVRGPFEWSRERIYDGLEVELERPGAIEGRVLVSSGDPLAGHVVGASNGWGHVHSATSDVDGRFRIDGLDPGPYQLRPCKPFVSGIVVAEHQLLPQSTTSEIEWDCDVRPGRVAARDVDLTRPYAIMGRLRFGGYESGLTAFVLRAYEGETRGEHLGAAKLGDDGTFALELGIGGPVLLEVVLRNEPGPRRAFFTQPLDLRPGRTECNTDIAPGALRVRSEVGEHLLLTLEWRGDENLRYQDAVSRPAGETSDLVAPALPPGRIRIGRHVGKESVFWREVEVRSGEETVVDYP